MPGKMGTLGPNGVNKRLNAASVNAIYANGTAYKELSRKDILLLEVKSVAN